MAEWTSDSLITDSGTALNLYWISPDTPRAIVHVNHGMSEHASRYQRFGRALAASGFAVVAQDHRGHGHTTARDAPLGSFGGKDGWNRVLSDVSAIIGYARGIYPDLPVFGFGHSMGGIVTLSHLTTHPGLYDGAAIWNCGFDTGFMFKAGNALLKAERMFKGSDVPSTLAQKLTFDAWNAKFRPNRTRFDWLSADEAEVDRYVSDPLCGFPASIGLWLHVLGAVQAIDDRALAAIPATLPIHLAAGGADPVSEGGLALGRLAARLRGAGLDDVTLRTFDGARHECLNDLRREEVTGQFIDWLEVRVGRFDQARG
jgi:alpha-beta hydrolase superfamily lysophospholipase